MKKILSVIIISVLSISLFGCGKEIPQQTNAAEQKAVKSLVEGFGSKLQTVSLLALHNTVTKSMKENYGSFVSPALLAKWLNDPQNAPGRLTSSPWADRIEIQTMQKIAEGKYEVKGKIIEITSKEKVNGGITAKQPIILIVKKIDNKWLIDEVSLGACGKNALVVYNNPQYGFSFTLPQSWKGYSIITDKWEGLSIAGTQGEKVVETGPLISIRHPQWTAQKPRQDIPIMVFTLAQWDALQRGEFHIGAAPIGPSELGRNNKYVFALPARYNFAFLPGFEEVENILKNKPLRPFNVDGDF